MKILFNTVNFGEHSEPYRYNYNGSTVDVYFDAGGSLMQTYESDQFGKFSERIEFDSLNNITGYHRYDYANKNKSEYTEYCKDKYQDYIRKMYTEIRGNFIHAIEEFTSKTNPSCSYIRESIRDESGKLLKAIMNGIPYFIAK